MSSTHVLCGCCVADTTVYAQLVAMGFGEDLAKLASRKYPFDAEAAVEFLSDPDRVMRAVERDAEGPAALSQSSGRRWQENPLHGSGTAGRDAERGQDDVVDLLRDNSESSGRIRRPTPTSFNSGQPRTMAVTSSRRVAEVTREYNSRKVNVSVYRDGINFGLRVEVYDRIFGRTTSLTVSDEEVREMIKVGADGTA